MGAMTSPTDPTSESSSESSSSRPSTTALAVALDRVGDRWSLLLVEVLLDGARRFNELSEALPGIAPNILSDRLRRLERDRVVVALPYSLRPPRMEYALTGDGRDLASALRLLADWGTRHLDSHEDGGHELLRHATCGTPLEARWFCPTCSTAVDDRDAPQTRSV